MKTFIHGTTLENANKIINWLQASEYTDPVIDPTWKRSTSSDLYVFLSDENNDSRNEILQESLAYAAITAAKHEIKDTMLCILTFAIPDDVAKYLIAPDNKPFDRNSYRINVFDLYNEVKTGKIEVTLSSFPHAYNPYLGLFYLAEADVPQRSINLDRHSLLYKAVDTVRPVSSTIWQDLYCMNIADTIKYVAIAKTKEEERDR